MSIETGLSRLTGRKMGRKIDEVTLWHVALESILQVLMMARCTITQFLELARRWIFRTEHERISLCLRVKKRGKSLTQWALRKISIHFYYCTRIALSVGPNSLRDERNFHLKTETSNFLKSSSMQATRRKTQSNNLVTINNINFPRSWKLVLSSSGLLQSLVSWMATVSILKIYSILEYDTVSIGDLLLT